MGKIIDKAKGRIKQATGVLTGNKALEREGERDERRGNVKGAVEDVKKATAYAKSASEAKTTADANAAAEAKAAADAKDGVKNARDALKSAKEAVK